MWQLHTHCNSIALDSELAKWIIRHYIDILFNSGKIRIWLRLVWFGLAWLCCIFIWNLTFIWTSVFANDVERTEPTGAYQSKARKFMQRIVMLLNDSTNHKPCNMFSKIFHIPTNICVWDQNCGSVYTFENRIITHNFGCIFTWTIHMFKIQKSVRIETQCLCYMQVVVFLFSSTHTHTLLNVWEEIHIYIVID